LLAVSLHTTIPQTPIRCRSPLHPLRDLSNLRTTMTNANLKIMLVAGARPNFVKIAPLMAEMRKHPGEVTPFLVHTGQHYDDVMSRKFFKDLAIPEADVNLAVGSASHAQQTARIMERFEPVLKEQKPDVVTVVGDVNSTIACALVATKLGVKVAHVEAGLRSFDRTMPEEINRIVTDHLSDFLFVTERSGVVNLSREGIPEGRVFLVGNVMVDALLANRAKAVQTSNVLDRFGLNGAGYAVATLHRPSNVDDGEVLAGIVEALLELSTELPVVFPAHPRTQSRLADFGLLQKIGCTSRVIVTGPLGYLDFLKLTSGARLILTDSGGLQEEACALQVPCLTLRRGTERPVTVESGWNRVVGVAGVAIVREARQALSRGPAGSPVELWDGRAAERIVAVLREVCSAETPGNRLRSASD